MVAQADKRLLWHPRGQNKFVVGGSTQITLYEWLPQSSQIKQVASQLELNTMKVCKPIFHIHHPHELVTTSAFSHSSFCSVSRGHRILYLTTWSRWASEMVVWTCFASKRPSMLAAVCCPTALQSRYRLEILAHVTHLRSPQKTQAILPSASIKFAMTRVFSSGTSNPPLLCSP